MKRQHLIVFTCFLVLCFLFYFPLLNNGFLSDDYRSLHRILIEKRIIYKSLFRPLIDISFYVNYMISGLNPAGFYLINILIHSAAVFMVYLVALRFKIFDDKRQRYFGILSGLLFLIYPFHNESVAWLTGRLSSIACLCALVIIYMSTTKGPVWRNFIWSAILFLIALSGYESIILLPFILLVWNWSSGQQKKVSLRIFIAWIILTLATLSIRFFISEELSSPYTRRVFPGANLSLLAQKSFKTCGRLFLPPMENSSLMTILFIGLAVTILLLLMIQWRKKRLNKKSGVLWISLIISLILPAAFGISTRTSEGDRLLYFPSVFLCMIIALYIISISSSYLRAAMTICISVYFVFFLLKNNQQWEEASVASENILRVAGSDPGTKKIFVNLPDELEGCFVFRQGFNEALRIRGIDSTKTIAFNYLERLEYLSIKDTIIPRYLSDKVFIYPEAELSIDNWLTNLHSGYKVAVDTSTAIYYWNKKELRLLFWKKRE